eukprot:TRINITY_DN97538_c0_g1_i1.p2 TRINITY_DN97538_c0_g1~~TRINITY_DN97538_c0_g1_i1.p2  ORF type:complete len:108 (+),score=18.27 TRINITY_DN97538_c0_g1_i1:107-430(+)
MVFVQFGSLIIICILLSLIFSLVFFPAILSIMGPEDGSCGCRRLMRPQEADAPSAWQIHSGAAADHEPSAPPLGVQVSPLRQLGTGGATSDAAAQPPVASQKLGRDH